MASDINKKEREFNLSKEIDYPNEDMECMGYINESSVRKFIKILKDDILNNGEVQV